LKYHKDRIEMLEVERQKYLVRSRWWVLIRLLSFSAIPVTVFIGYPLGGYSAIILIIEVVLFLIFVRKSAENKESLNFVKHLITINENEIKALGHDFTAFPNGERFEDHSHPFSYDMDVFGKDSFFQIINRTVTKRGETTLAHRLTRGVKDQSRSIEAVEEIAENPDWFQEYLAYGMQQKDDVEDLSVAAWAKNDINERSWMKVLSYILPVIAISLTLLYSYEFIHGAYFLIGLVLVMMPIRQVLKQSNQLHRSLSELGNGIQAMQQQMDHLSKIEFKSDLLRSYQNEFFGKGKNAKDAIDQLAKLVKHADYRDNAVVAFVLNFYLAWDLSLTVRARKWTEEYRHQIDNWEQLIFEFEVLISGANYKRLLSDAATKPQLKEDLDQAIEMSGLGHPIIPRDKRVDNSFELKSQERFAIITGPNMAGKSTFLRSVGVNIMMAQAGFHVLAERFVFPKLSLYSSMRTTDDLSEETSYFHAELLRLRFIMDAIDRGEHVFIILDEILKGTNSKDKEEGSRKFLKKLEEKGARGLIATHDLSLTELADANESIVNKYFDTNISGDEISFDYKMRDGVAQNMNASFLLRKMKLTE
tara:strand:+ start:7199 stop:8965 length:1767 start_codon:yes stop_codon:yes gene_type:complete